jgi:hypothetical protein
MNMRVSDPIKRQEIVHELCERVELDDPTFGPWLSNYLRENPSSWLGKGRKHEYWLVPIELVEDAISVIPAGRDHCMLNTVHRRISLESIRLRYGDLNIAFRERSDGKHSWGVLAIAPVPSRPAVVASQTCGFVITVLRSVFILLLDPILKWGRKTCPQCFSRDLHAFTFASADERPSHYCNGCNTIWPPRK